MPKNVLVVNPDHSSCYIPAAQAAAEVKEGLAEWDGEKSRVYRMAGHGRHVPSVRVGEYLATALREGKPWGQVCLADMARRTDRPAFFREQ
jgi:hypothetical protein